MQTIVLPAQSLPPFARGLMALTVLVMVWEVRYRSRKSLGQLEAHLLRDIGLCRIVAKSEARKPFWQA